MHTAYALLTLGVFAALTIYPPWVLVVDISVDGEGYSEQSPETMLKRPLAAQQEIARIGRHLRGEFVGKRIEEFPLVKVGDGPAVRVRCRPEIDSRKLFGEYAFVFIFAFGLKRFMTFYFMDFEEAMLRPLSATPPMPVISTPPQPELPEPTPPASPPLPSDPDARYRPPTS